jgi:transposase-like protein
MVPIQIIRDYLINNEEGMKLLLTWFLNLVMQVEALERAGAEHYERTETRKGYRNGERITVMVWHGKEVKRHRIESGGRSVRGLHQN